MNISQNNYDMYNEKINTLHAQFHAALNDYKQAYVLYQSNPNFNEYKSTFFSIQQNLQDMNSNLFILVNEIEKGIDDMNSDISGISANLSEEKKQYDKLTQKFVQVNGGINGANIMIENYNEQYFRQYVTNFTTILGTCMVFLFFVRTFKLR